MNRLKRSLLAAALASAVAFTPAVYAAQSSVMTVYAHGCHGGSHHYGSGTNYYYCNGHAAHTHANGVCPYYDEDYGTHYYYCGGHAAHEHHNGVCPYANLSTQTIKKVQKRLNRYGYQCGRADGVIGTKTVKAVKKYQRANGLKADGIIGQNTLKALGIN